MMFSAISIRARLILTMTVSVLLLMTMGAFFFFALTRVDRAAAELNARWLPSVRLLAETKYKMESHRLRFVRAVFTPDTAERAAILAAAEDRRGEIDRSLSTYDGFLRDDDERARFAAVRQRWVDYLAEEQAIAVGLPTLSAAEASRLVNDRSRFVFDAVNDAVNGVIAHIGANAEKASAEAVATFDRAIRVSLTIFACALLLLGVFVVLVIRSVSRPIDRITATMLRLAEGDRAVSLEGMHGRNEIGRMAAAVEVFRGHLIERDAARAELERSFEILEDMVEERSSELKQANETLKTEVEERIQANRQLESMHQELIRTENLAVIGQLSAGIAHELNQPLAALATLSQNAARFLDLGDEATVRGNLDRIVRLVDRMGILTSRLRSFARRTGAERETVDLGRSVENALALLGHRHDREPMKIETRPSPTPVLVNANAVRIEQILVNLISNAFDATRSTEDATTVIAWHEADGKAILTVSDNGQGFPPDILTRIFEPFFSTKNKTGGGLGLGLAISADIARIYGGALTAADGEGGGAVFTLTLPAESEETTGNPEAAAPAFPETETAGTTLSAPKP